MLKDQTKLEQCQEIFKESPNQITCEGKRHLGAAVGMEQFKNEYIDEKVSKWTNNILTLSKIVQSQPHACQLRNLYLNETCTMVLECECV